VNCVIQKPNFVHDNGNWAVTKLVYYTTYTHTPNKLTSPV